MRSINKYYLINSLLCGLSAILYTLYNAFAAIAAFGVYHAHNMLNDENIVFKIKDTARFTAESTIPAIILFIIVIIINHVLIKKEKSKLLIALMIISAITLIYIIYKNIILFI